MSATTTMKLISMPTQMPTQMPAQMRTQASSIAFAASNIAAATTAITIATCHRRSSCPQDDRPSGLWPLALKPIAILPPFVATALCCCCNSTPQNFVP